MIDCIQQKDTNSNPCLGINKVPCLIYSRVVGYYSAVQISWNPGKKEEFKERKTLIIPEALKCKTSAGAESEKCLKLN